MNKILAAFVAMLLSSASFAGEPIGNLERFESDVTQCIANATKSSRCIESYVTKSVLPGNENLLSVAKQADGLLVQWLDKDKVFAVHPISVKSTGDLFQKRTYMIEDTSGNLMVFNFSVIKRLGKWYLFSFDVNSNSDVVAATLKGDK